MGAKTYFIYGSLRRGMYNYSALKMDKGATFKGIGVLKGYKLWSLGDYPAVSRSDNKDDVVVGELFTFEDKLMEDMIARMEAGAGYDEHNVVVLDEHSAMVNAFVYAMDEKRLQHAEVVESGDWVKEVESR